MGFSRQEYGGGLTIPSPGDLPNPGFEPVVPELAEGFFTTEPLRKSYIFASRILVYMSDQGLNPSHSSENTNS